MKLKFVMFIPLNITYHSDMKCRVCDEEFQPKRRGAPPMYCGSKCKDKARYIRDREKRLEANSIFHRGYYQRNREEILAKNRKWIEVHPEKPAEYQRAYRRRNPEKTKEAVRQYLALNRDAVLARKKQHHKEIADEEKAYRQAHREEGNRSSREWLGRFRAEHREEYRLKQREWYRRNPHTYLAKTHRRRTRQTQAGGTYTQEQWDELLRIYGYRCLSCGKGSVKLTADHVVPVVMGGTSNIDNIQPLCGPCNSKKHQKIIDFRVILCR